MTTQRHSFGTAWRSLGARCLSAFAAALLTITVTAGAQEPDRDAVGRAFEYAQLAMLSESTISLNAATVLASRDDGEIAAWEGERQAALAELARTERAFEDALAEGKDPAAQQPIAQRRTALLAEIETIETRIRDRDPAYWDLLHPEAVPLAELQRLLHPDEALLLIASFEKKSYSFAITATSANWSRIDDYGSNELQADVDAVRAGIKDEVEGYAEPGSGIDLARAHRIYAGLIAPLEGHLGSKRRIYSVVSGPLSALPLGLLPRAPADATGEVRWLADGHVIMSLATVSMLRAQRCLLVAPAERHPGCTAARAGGRGGKISGLAGQRFLGIGNPAMGTAGARSVQPADLTGDWTNRGVANRDMLLRMPSLPGTERELQVAAASFGPERSRLLMGPDAGEPNVRDALGTGRPRFIAFATHGLLASQAGGLSEPGLVLSPPPDNIRPDDDGFLSASEIAQFKLARAIVILSACNTGTEERGIASRNLNSIARAFQFAGAREVIASHWSVNDEATARLMQIFFQKIAADSSLTPAAAFQDSQAELRRDPRWASPAFWAPFSIIGADD